jgi:carboxymethylenebutenolidase
MAETVQVDGSDTTGYLVRPPGGSGPGVIVVQEWWGIDPGIKATAERIAGAGLVALVPDLYHGELAAHDEMDKAAHLMTTLPPERAGADMSAAVDHLAGLDGVTGSGLGVVGLCMGGMLSFILAANRPDRIKAVVSFYGFPQGDAEPDWSKLTAKVRGHMAEHDDFFPPDAARALESKLQDMGKDVVLTVHPGTGHAFCGPHNALGTLNEDLAESIWPEVFAFLHGELD